MDVNADGLVDQAGVLIMRSNVGRRLAPLAAPAAVPPQTATKTATLRRAAEYVLSKTWPGGGDRPSPRPSPRSTGERE
jgi:hypothetical protein